MEAKETSGSKKKLVALIVLLVVLILATAGGLIAYLFFNSPKVKIAMAIKNTFQGSPEIVTDLREHPITTEDYSVTTKMDIELDKVGELGLNLNIEADETGKSASGSVDLPFVKGVKIDAELTDQKLLIDVPLLKSTLLAYDYTKENDGMIASYVDTDALNEVLAMIYKIDLGRNGFLGGYEVPEDGAEGDEPVPYGAKEDIAQILYDFYSMADFHKIESKEYKVNGDDEKCVGYSTVLVDDDMTDLISDLKEACISNDIDTSDLTGVRTDELFQKMQDKADELGEVEIRFYIYDDALAAMEITTEKSEISLLFMGGDYRWQNTTLMYNDDVIFELQGEIADDTEHMSFYTGLTLSENAVPHGLDYEYGLTDGALKVTLLDEDKDKSDSISGSLTFDDDEGYIHLTLDPIENHGFTMSGSLTIKEEGEVEHLSGDELDIGIMTKEEYDAFIEDFLTNKLGGFGNILNFLW